MARKAGPVEALFRQANASYPNRSRVSDGWIGDAAHRSRTSDHNPDGNGIVHAGDVTHDPGNGLDCHRLARELAASRDPRVKYIIWDRRIWQNGWKAYKGANPHTKHLHLSVYGDISRDWNIPMFGGHKHTEDEDDMQLHETFKDWAGNEQTVYSWMMNTDRRMAEYISPAIAVILGQLTGSTVLNEYPGWSGLQSRNPGEGTMIEQVASTDYHLRESMVNRMNNVEKQLANLTKLIEDALFKAERDA